jgi:adenine-specific DNA-methyltransferase
MPTLDWIGKKAVLNHHRQVPYHLLRCDNSLSVGESGSGNLLVQGDNLLALKALLPYYAGQVKCIYIDPPYNTGNENWVYNDAVNSPEMRKWLGHVVGGEAEDLSRHDKWLCMMYPRLALLKEFLREDGAIFVSIDDVEVGHLRLLMNEVFGERNFLANFVWQSKDTPGNNSSGIAETHNHVIAYRKSPAFFPNLLVRNEKQLATYSNPDGDPRGPWLATPLTRVEHRDRDYYSIKNKVGRDVWPPKGSSWRRPPATIQKLAEDNRMWWGKDGDSTFPMEKKFLSEVKEGVVNQTWWPYEFAGSTRNASAEMKQLFGGEKKFDTPKPIRLVQVVLGLSTDSDSIVLDSFAGSGTTGHAVLAANNADGGNRRFILVEMEPEICRTVSAQRLTGAIQGFTRKGNGEKTGEVLGLGGGFRYCTLAEPLFDETGKIGPEVKFADLASHVYFTETGEPLAMRRNKPPAPPGDRNGKAASPGSAGGFTDQRPSPPGDRNGKEASPGSAGGLLSPRGAGGLSSPLIGVCKGTAYYLLFNGVLGDKRPDGGNVLTGKVLGQLPPHDGPKVVYGEGCRLGAARLAREGIVFKQVPYEIKTA